MKKYKPTIHIYYYAAPHEVDLKFEKKLAKALKKFGYKKFGNSYNFKKERRELSFWPEEA